MDSAGVPLLDARPPTPLFSAFCLLVSRPSFWYYLADAVMVLLSFIAFVNALVLVASPDSASCCKRIQGPSELMVAFQLSPVFMFLASLVTSAHIKGLLNAPQPMGCCFMHYLIGVLATVWLAFCIIGLSSFTCIILGLVVVGAVLAIWYFVGRQLE